MGGQGGYGQQQQYGASTGYGGALKSGLGGGGIPGGETMTQQPSPYTLPTPYTSPAFGGGASPGGPGASESGGFVDGPPLYGGPDMRTPFGPPGIEQGGAYGFGQQGPDVRTPFGPPGLEQGNGTPPGYPRPYSPAPPVDYTGNGPAMPQRPPMATAPYQPMATTPYAGMGDAPGVAAPSMPGAAPGAQMGDVYNPADRMRIALRGSGLM